MTTRQARSFLDKHGRPIKKVQEVRSGTEVDDMGDPVTVESTATVTAIVSRQAIRSDPERDSSGYSPAGIVDISVASTIPVHDGASTRATEWVIDGEQYETLKTDEQANGIIMVQAERMRES